MHRILSALLPLLALIATPAAGQELGSIPVTAMEQATGGSDRYVQTPFQAPIPQGIAKFGPFRVLDGTRAALVDATDGTSPAQFAAMLKAFPGISLLELVECPGTEDDRANLRLGRAIRAHGIATFVPTGGSVRSGGVELFLAGTRRIADPGAEFAVHAWADDEGLEANDYPANAPENRAYLDYYREMGMTPTEAAAFYAMTNSVQHADAKWLSAEDMQRWVRLD